MSGPVVVTEHAVERMRERGRGLMDAPRGEVVDAVSQLVQDGIPFGGGYGTQFARLGLHRDRALVAICDREQYRIVVVTVLTRDQATANMTAIRRPRKWKNHHQRNRRRVRR